ncbi:hypothetical protein, partial [Jatrophihabitans endophyticus]|uniref:hypothetical protein n=1 Tax=Jatrophihabitans endophyticus TaxID=1206085 RepID=UPI0019E8831F
MIGGDEELGTSGAGGWFWRVVVGLVIAVVVAGVVVGLVRHHDSSPSAGPDASTPATHAGPVIPTFASVHPGPSADRSETFEIGPHHTRATLFGPARVLFASCVGSQCRARATVPEPVRRAVRTVVKGCSPVLTDLVRHRAGRSTLVERQ